VTLSLVVQLLNWMMVPWISCNVSYYSEYIIHILLCTTSWARAFRNKKQIFSKKT